MNRDTALRIIALALGAFGVYRALYLPAMLAGPTAPLFFGFLLQAASGIAAGIGVWRGAGWAAYAIALLAASVGATGLIEVALGVIPWLWALLVTVAAIVVAILLVRYVAGGAVRQQNPQP